MEELQGEKAEEKSNILEFPSPKEGNKVSEFVKPKKKIAIIGCSDHKEKAPWGDDTWEIWGVNNLFISLTPERMKNVGKWFEIHNIEKLPNGKFLRRKDPNFRGQDVNNYIADLAKLHCPVYMQKHWDEIPNSIIYPVQEVINIIKSDYFTNTISYEIAIAIIGILQGQYDPTIGIWGVDMAVKSDLMGNAEYSHQKPSCEFFLGLAAGMGINIILPPESDLLKARFLYAFNDPELSAWEHKRRNMVVALKQRMNEAAQREQMAREQRIAYGGAIQYANEEKELWR
jgi:hypothetical protein